jgi:hypothetical protein
MAAGTSMEGHWSKPTPDDPLFGPGKIFGAPITTYDPPITVGFDPGGGGITHTPTTGQPTGGGGTTTDTTGLPTPETPTSTLPLGIGTSTTTTTPAADTIEAGRINEEIAQRQQFAESTGMAIAQARAKEMQTESSMKASTAARGLRMTGSPLYQLNAQKAAAKNAIGEEERQRQASIASMKMQTQLGYSTYLNSKSLDVYQSQQQQANQWLSAFATVAGWATDIVTGTGAGSLLTSLFTSGGGSNSDYQRNDSWGYPGYNGGY